MFSRRMVLALVTVSVMAIAAAGLAPAVQAQTSGTYFVSASSACDHGAFTFYNQGFDLPTSPALQNGLYSHYVEAWDGEGTYLGERGFNVDPFSSGYYSGSIDYPVEAVDTVTFYLIAYAVAVDVARLAPDRQQGGIVIDSVTVPAGCVSAPGCDVFIPVDTAVVGTFTQNATLYGQPGEGTDIIIEAGKSYYVLGQDETESYYKILIACAFGWVEKSTVGPTFDEPWNGAPLPTIIVD